MSAVRIVSLAVASLALSSAAIAATNQTGSIKTVNAEKHEIILDNGKTFEAPALDLCRIFPVGRLWVLQVETTASGWQLGLETDESPERLKFPTLAAAVSYAEQHCYDYRIITPSSVVHIAERGRNFISGCNRPVTRSPMFVG